MSTGEAGSGGGEDEAGTGGNSEGGASSGSSSTGSSTSGSGSGSSSGGTYPTLMGNGGCAGQTCANPMCKVAPGWTAVDPKTEPFPGVGFSEADGSPDHKPGYIPNDYIIPTLDDVPDGPDTDMDGYQGGNWTTQDLAFLDSKHLHWDFFMNTQNWAPVTGSSPPDDESTDQAVLDILKLHNPANHTVYHVWMSAMDQPADPCYPGVPSCCDCADFPKDSCNSELTGVESIVSKMSGGGLPHLTRFRPPYGYPYVSPQGPNMAALQKVVSKFAVVVGWNMDPTQDADFPPACAACGCDNGMMGLPVQANSPNYDTKAQVEEHIQSGLGNAPGQGTSWGIVLMHGVLPWTHDAIVELFDPDVTKNTPSTPNVAWIAKHGFKTATVEDAICWKYGMHSWDVVNTLNNYKGTANERKPN